MWNVSASEIQKVIIIMQSMMNLEDMQKCQLTVGQCRRQGDLHCCLRVSVVEGLASGSQHVKLMYVFAPLLAMRMALGHGR